MLATCNMSLIVFFTIPYLSIEHYSSSINQQQLPSHSLVVTFAP